MNLIVLIKRCTYIITHLWAIDGVEKLSNGGIRLWFDLADGRTGIPTTYFMVFVLIFLASVGTASFVCVAVHEIAKFIIRKVMKRKANKTDELILK